MSKTMTPGEALARASRASDTKKHLGMQGGAAQFVPHACSARSEVRTVTSIEPQKRERTRQTSRAQTARDIAAAIRRS